jgi:hypothetical protein
MQSTLIFFCGAGAGAFAAAITMFVVMARASKQGAATTKETIRLMKERNDIDLRKATALETLVDSFQK